VLVISIGICPQLNSMRAIRAYLKAAGSALPPLVIADQRSAMLTK
jgi:hypothetical protein